MALPKPLASIFQYIEQNQQEFLDRLSHAIAIPSVPIPENEKHIIEMITWMIDNLKSLGVETELRNIEDDSYNGPIPIPPIILGNLETGNCPNKPTVLVYGHLDVKNACIEDGWNNEPYDLLQEDNRLFGRGVVDKSPLIVWLNAIEAYQSSGIDCPVNIKFVLESLGTKDSCGLRNILLLEKDKFLAHVDYVCINKGCWLQPDIPCIIRSLKGMCSFSVEIECASKNLDSNVCAGIVQDAMGDMLFLLSSLIDCKGNLNVPFKCQDEDKKPYEEYLIYEDSDVDFQMFLKNVDAHCLSHGGDKFEILKHRMTHPTLIIHGIKSSCNGSNDMAGVVVAELSIRTVSNQTPDQTFERVRDYLMEVWSDYGSGNIMQIFLGESVDAWKSDIDHIHYDVATKAFKHVYGKDTWFLSSGYIIPVVNMLETVLQKNVIVFPIGCDENFDVNESLNLINYIDGTKTIAAYLYEMGELPILWSSTSKSSTSFTSCKSIPEVCVCGKFNEGIQAASGDTENCVCPDPAARRKSTPEDPDEKDKANCLCPPKEPTVNLTVTVTENCVCPDTIKIPEATPEIAEKKDEINYSLTPEEVTELNVPDILEMVSTDKTDLIEVPLIIAKKCKCVLVPIAMTPPSAMKEVISLTSNASVASTDPTASLLTEQKTEKDIITLSVDTMNCECLPLKFKGVARQSVQSLSVERRDELTMSLRSVGSEISGISAAICIEDLKTPKMAILGCVCPEKSTDTILNLEGQVDRMQCPITFELAGMQCTKGGRRKHHIRGPPPIDEEQSEVSMGPLSHCSCGSEESIAIIPQCDCATEDIPIISKVISDNTLKNLENEVD